MQCAADYVFKALADPTRRKLFERLTRDGEQTVHALTNRAGVSRADGFQAPGRAEAREVGKQPALGTRNTRQCPDTGSSCALRLDASLWYGGTGSRSGVASRK